MREAEVTACQLAERRASSSRRVLLFDLIDGEVLSESIMQAGREG